MPIQSLSEQLTAAGQYVEAQRMANRFAVQSQEDLRNTVQNVAGLYWIETNMPLQDMCTQISLIAKKNKVMRRTTPPGIGFIEPEGDSVVVYSGTGHALQTRLLEHMFNEGNMLTNKLSLVVNLPPFNQYLWRVSYVYIQDHPSRYALESWWRLNVGWPRFCIR